MMRDLTEALHGWLEDGSRQIGEVLIRRIPAGHELRHIADRDSTGLVTSSRAEEAQKIALLADDGSYRPLKTAPTLRRGRSLELSTVAEVRRALDLLYPAMVGIFRDFQAGTLHPVMLRETLGRQSGMYAVTRKLSDPQAQALIGSVCRSDGGCLKTILWKIDPALGITSLPTEKFDPAACQASLRVAEPLPMLCHEACNILVARAREVVKSPTPKE